MEKIRKKLTNGSRRYLGDTSFRKRADFRRLQKVTARDKAKVEIATDRYVVHIGKSSFYVKTDLPPAQCTLTYDFAVFGLAALSMSNGTEIEFISPVSQSAAGQIEKMRRAYETWTMGLYPLRLKLPNVVPDPNGTKSDSVGICLSGGIDSTAGAIEAKRAGNITHGVLIAGADYPNAKSSGFIELLRRVERQAEILDLEVLLTETNIRSLGFKWELLFSLNLAMCLHAQSGALGKGAIGADFTLSQDLVLHPWGTSHALTKLFSSKKFEILSMNKDLGRTEKLQEIYNYSPELVENLSVCWKNTSIGGNCGECLKCKRTMLNFVAAIGHIPDIFSQRPDLIAFAQNLRVPRKFSGVRTELVQIGNIYQNLPDGHLKSALEAHYDKLRETYMMKMPRSLG